jgi:putative nucleotidyltransferase with HDIG domain
MTNIIKFTKEKIQALFVECPDKVHGFDHAERVAVHATYIAKEEGEDVLMSTLAGLLHDIGRAIEKYPEKFPEYDSKKTHHELSYDMLQTWFREESIFSGLTDDQKIELLYAVRYHWNDEACEYPSAYILRDADKIDGLGDIGMRRHRIHCSDDEQLYILDIRLRYEWLYNFKTKTAQRMYEEMDLMVPFEKERTKILKELIKPIEL